MPAGAAPPVPLPAVVLVLPAPTSSPLPALALDPPLPIELEPPVLLLPAAPDPAEALEALVPPALVPALACENWRGGLLQANWRKIAKHNRRRPPCISGSSAMNRPAQQRGTRAGRRPTTGR